MTPKERMIQYERMGRRRGMLHDNPAPILEPDSSLITQRRKVLSKGGSLVLGTALMTLVTACTGIVAAQAEVKPSVGWASSCRQSNNGRLESDDAINVRISHIDRTLIGAQVVVEVGDTLPDGRTISTVTPLKLSENTNVDIGAATFTKDQKKEIRFSVYYEDPNKPGKIDGNRDRLFNQTYSTDCVENSPERAYENSR